jgi:ankyrin repeat protein
VKVCDANAKFASKFSDNFSISYIQFLHCIQQLTHLILHCRDDQGCTPLHIAAARNRGAIVNELLKFGAGLMRC